MKAGKTSGGKLKELILYISQRSAIDPKFGMTKLNKLLFYSDFVHFRKFGVAISGEEYFKLENGPAPRRMLPVVEDLKRNRELGIEERQYFGNIQRRPVALRNPNLDLFSAQEISTVDDIIERLRDASAKTVSELSHSWIGWELAEMKETIPYGVARVLCRPLTESEIQHGLTLARS